MTTTAVHLTGDLYAVVAPLREQGELAGAAIDAGGRTLSVDLRSFRADASVAVLTLRVPRGLGRLTVRTATRSHELGELGDALTDLDEFAASVNGFDADVRARICTFLALTQVEHEGVVPNVALAHAIASVSSRIRAQLPAASVSASSAACVAADVVYAIGDSSFYVRGWVANRGGRLARLTVVSPEGCRAELLTEVHRYPRPDVGDVFFGDAPEAEATRRSGFAAFFELEAPSLADEGWMIEVETSDGAAAEAAIVEVVRDPTRVRNRILSELALEESYERALLVEHVHPALEGLQREVRPPALADVREYGPPVHDAAVSVVVPLYGRTDFMQHQLAQFALDDDFRAVDLVYVLDSPELAPGLDYAAQQLYELYRVPFRVAVVERNSGYSAANNLGASIARGRLLLLLNSDVIPDATGWLSTMTRFYDATPAIGALGAMLVYEDETIQHAGMYFAREPRSRLWTNEHFFKGIHRTLPAANVARRVPAVTGACLMIDLELFRAVGGLDGGYIQGDFEDSHLCLRLAEEGFETWYLPAAQLYHLEAQSYARHLRALTWRYNAWRHATLWEETIGGLAGASDLNIRLEH